MHIKFTKDLNNGLSFYNSQDPCIVRAIGGAAEFCLNSKIFSLLTLGHLHTFIHELGHAVAYRILTGGEATIHIALNTQSGMTSFGGKELRPLSGAGSSWVSLSGPLADVIFSAVLIIGIFALTHFVPMPSGLQLGLRIAIAGPAGFWIVGELFYAIFSTCKRDNGDFGNIAQRSWVHLLLSYALLITICALTALGIAFLI